MAVEERFRGANVIDAGRLSPYWGEHAARYVFALDHIENKSVMDIACGTGYGLAFLKQRARAVTGVDIDIAAAVEAMSEKDEKVSVLLGSGLNLPFHDESFDVVTSFETLEHLQERQLFLWELKRILRPNGLLILSTPNANYTMPKDGKPSNPFHVFEYKPEELRAEIGSIFVIEQFVGQSLRASYGIPPFYDAQQRLPKDLITQTKLFGWKVMNKIPLAIREGLSKAFWRTSFYPNVSDYEFDASTLPHAPVLVAVCRKSD
ncbi:MAG TPA: class I SAM-dependent methyltransferase [Pyrinomonadaceae bacterium]|nr:class I SAM-dependent methyltransferase [Pyrinomonadaceae bacterium]